jgi:hypothetical protein
MPTLIDIIKCVKEVAYARSQLYKDREFYPFLPSHDDYSVLYQELAKLYVDIRRYDGLIERFFVARYERGIADIIEKELRGIKEEDNE